MLTVHDDPANPDDVAIAGYGRGTLRFLLLIGLLLFGLLAALLAVPTETLRAAAPIALPVVLSCTCLAVGGYAVGRI